MTNIVSPAAVPMMQPLDDGFGTNMSILQSPFPPSHQHLAFDGPKVTPLTMIAMRMGWGPYSGVPIRFGSDLSVTPFQFIEAVRAVGGGKTYVFVLTRDGKPVTLEDDSPLFPSDQLITQLRLLEQNGVKP